MAELPSEDQGASPLPEKTSEQGFCHHLIESHSGLSFLLNENGRLLCWNATLEAATGLGPEKLVHLPFPEIFPDLDRARVMEGIASALREHKTTLDVDLPG